MSDTQTPIAEEPKQFTAADAVKKVRRTIIETEKRKDREGNEIQVSRPRKVAIDPTEVMSCKDYGTHIVVVTSDGQKFTNAED
ncbi:hypothetical protein BH10PSE18_BH10PSE18_19000 [soil metagenome]